MRYLKRYDDMINEGRVKRSERLDVFRNDDIIVVMPLTHNALRKYANKCQWCINDDIYEWEDYHKGKHVVIIQRKPKGTKKGVTGNSTAEEIYVLNRWDSGNWDIDAVEQTLKYQFRNETSMERYLLSLTSDASNFATDIVYYSPESGSVYDMEDNNLADCNKDIYDVPNMSVVIVDIINDFVEEHGKEHVVNEGLSFGKPSAELKRLKEEIKMRSYELSDLGAEVKVLDSEDTEPVWQGAEKTKRILDRYDEDYDTLYVSTDFRHAEGDWFDELRHFLAVCNEEGRIAGPNGPLTYLLNSEDPESYRDNKRLKDLNFIFVKPRKTKNMS